MATVLVMLEEDHALAQTGFRGVLRNLEGVDVEVMVGPWTTGARDSIRLSKRLRAFSSQERRLLGLIAAGCNAEQIADRLAMSPEVAEGMRLHLMEQLGLDRIASEVRYALHMGLLRDRLEDEGEAARS